MVAAPVAGDHIGRNRPGTAGNAEEGNLGRQGVRHPAQGLDDRIEKFRTRHETLDNDAGQWRRKTGSLALRAAQLLPQSMGDLHYAVNHSGSPTGTPTHDSNSLWWEITRSE